MLIDLENDFTINNEFFSQIINNCIDLYIYINSNKIYKHVYDSLDEKYYIFEYLCNLFYSSKSNININIKYIDFFYNIILNENILSTISEEKIIKFIEKSMLFYKDLDNYEDYYKYDYKYKMLIIYNLYFNYNNKDIIQNINITILSKFIISFVEDINICVNDFIYYCEINNDIEIVKFYDTLLKLYNFNYNKFNKIFDSLNENVIITSINKLYDGLKILYNKLINVALYKPFYITCIFSFMKFNNIFNNNIDNIHYLKDENSFFNIELIKEILDYIIKNQKYIIIYKNDINNIKTFIDNYESYNYNYNTISYDLSLAPDNFIDPIYNTLIETPIILPNSNIIMDYNVIKQHLLYGNFDPFNRSELTIEMIDNYNNLENNKKKNNELKININNWKQEQIKLEKNIEQQEVDEENEEDDKT